ncbi:MAG TPA: methyltransferase domain-containing protein [Polyangiaceae bacterium]|jgi:tetratricopeptide (TPR) repeat protein|nr:methyltransferase domain-containing protein [Polyangiaceae bacterium]
MTSAAPQKAPQALGGREPGYEFGRREAEVVARFPTGKRVAVTRGRGRSYPGLISVAPGTLAFYQLFASLITGKHALDAGSGSSEGTRVLCEHVPHVTALDHDARALEFGREYAPNAEFLQVDLCHGSPVDRADAALLVDVLGHLTQPEAALRSLRACLPVGSPLFVAEPKSYGSQRLVAPARRAYSKAGLGHLLLRSGFEVDQAESGNTNFVTIVARRSADPALDALAEAFYQASRGQLAAARSEFSRARQSDRQEVKLEALLGEAEAAFRANDGDVAVRCYFEANDLSRDDGRALSGLARVALVTGELDDALRLAVDSVKRDPTEASANMAMASAAEQLAHPDAFNAWRVAANLAPDDPDVATGLARVSAAKQNYAFAIVVLERLRGYGNALGVDFHVTLGWLLLADGRKSDAAVEARYALTLAPKHQAVTELALAAEA